MARAYTANKDNVSVSAGVDLVNLQTTGTMVVEIDELDLGQVSLTVVGNLRCTFKRFSGGFAPGSGGNVVVPAKHVFGDPVSTCITHCADTTPTTSGTPITMGADAINVINGYQKLPAPEDRWSITISQMFVWSLDTAPGSAETMSMQAVFRELV